MRLFLSSLSAAEVQGGGGPSVGPNGVSKVWAPSWTIYLAVAVIGATFLVVTLDPTRRKASSRPAKAASTLPMPKKKKEHVDPPFTVMVHSYLGYAYLIARGAFLDLLELVVGALLFWRRWRTVAQKEPTSPPLSCKVGAPFFTGWVVFYTRRLYRRIEDCWNRPICSEPGTSIDVCLRTKRGQSVLGRDGAPMVLSGETKRCLNLGSYNYLGFGGVDPTCTPAVIDAVRHYGVSACSSRLEAGHRPVHDALEATVARFLEKEAAMVIGMGFATNSSLIPALVAPDGSGKGVLLLSDALNHSSIVEGVRGSGAKVVPFAHNNMRHLEAILRRATAEGQPSGAPWRKIIILVEGIYSMEGEFASLRSIVALKKRFHAYLYLDEAHSIGAVGPRGQGVTDHLGIPTADVDVLMGTFTKSFGSIGGYVAADAAVVASLRRHSAGSLYASAMSPPAAQQTLSALRMIMGEDPRGDERGTLRMAKLRANTNFFREGLLRLGLRVLGDVDSPIIPIMLYHPEKIYKFSQACLRRDLAVVVVGYPATPMLLSRARFCIAATHTEKELVDALAKIGEAAKETGVLYDAGTAATRSEDPDHVAKARMAMLQSAPLVAHLTGHSGETSWKPEPLCPASVELRAATAAYEHATAAASTSPAGVDLRTTDFLRLAAAPGPRQAAVDALRKYGCGTCGPRGFYGTLDVHLELERRLASFLGTEGVIVYSFGIATPSSVIPAFVRKGDLLFVDSGIHFTTATGVRLSRGTATYFTHNDMADLERRLARNAEQEREVPPSKRKRVFILVEGLYHNSGSLCDLPTLLRLRDQYGAYLIVDETLSIGVLGATGRGIAEHYGVAPRVIDILVGSMEHSLGSVGGFCAGADWVVSHQRLSGSGYCFSASLPAYATCAAIAGLAQIDTEPFRLTGLHAASAALAQACDAHLPALPFVQYEAHAESPIAHVSLAPAACNALPLRTVEHILRHAGAMAAAAEGGGSTQLMLHSGLAHIQTPCPPSIRLAVHAEVEPKSLHAAVGALASALAAALAEHASALELAPLAPTKSVGLPQDASDSSFSHGKARTIKPASDSCMPGAADPTADPTPAVTLPILYALEQIRRISRDYVLRQMEWHSYFLLPQLAALRAARRPMLHALFTMGQFVGSESFYFTFIPVLCWSLGPEAHMNMFVAYFSINVYVGNWLKNFMALSRPTGADISRSNDTDDFGWPSMYALNAVGLPFFALRYWFGAFGQGTIYSAENEFLTAASYTLGILWVLVVCGARLYSGVSSPADVQGGMIVGGVLVRIWLPVCEDVDAILSTSKTLFGMPMPIALVAFAAALMAIHPFTPAEPRSWTALVFSTKAVAFTVSYIIGSNACHSYGWCGAVPNGPGALAALTQQTAFRSFCAALGRLLVRNGVGFVLLYGSGNVAAMVSRSLERFLRMCLPTKRCAPIILRNAALFTANGLMVSMGVPAVLSHTGL